MYCFLYIFQTSLRIIKTTIAENIFGRITSLFQSLAAGLADGCGFRETFLKICILVFIVNHGGDGNKNVAKQKV